MRTHLALLAGVVAIASLSSGCVSQNRADDLQALYRKSESQKIDLQARLEEANARIEALRAASGNHAEVDNLLAERDRLLAALTEAEDQLRALTSRTVLPPEVDSALKELASASPDLMVYDPDMGMVRFASDLTFSLGSTEINEQAARTLDELALVINSQVVAAYEVRIVGHTDNVPVTNAMNIQRYGDNWGLSAFRAIAVKDVFESAGVAPTRISIAGYGEHHPIVANGPKGAQANRRVEIFLVDASRPGAVPVGEPAEAAAEPVSAAPGDFK